MLRKLVSIPVLMMYMTAMSSHGSSRLKFFRLLRTTFRSETARMPSAPTAIAYPTVMSHETLRNRSKVTWMNLRRVRRSASTFLSHASRRRVSGGGAR